MRAVLAPGADLDGFRRAVRGLVAAGVPPERASFATEAAPGLFADALPAEAPPVALPRPVSELIELVACHSDPERFALLYALVWRVLKGERQLLEVHSDPLVHRLERMRKSIRRDLHKMHAFLRFRQVLDGGEERYAAWFEPDHFIVEATAQFFVDRFRALRWSIHTPKGSLHWDREALVVGPPGRREDVPDTDAFEAGWLGYYESTFNPSRVNPTMMRAEMAKKYWHNLPEAVLIPGLIQQAPARARDMLAKQAEAPRHRDPLRAVAAMAAQDPATLDELNRIIAASEPLVPGATRAVLGEGPMSPRLAFVGEQPGDQEDLQGRCFVGPAGQLLDQALGEAGIERSQAYLTNAVKHFKFVQQGKRRLHQSPTTGEIKHYRWWLKKELGFVQPGFVVAMGGSAATALVGEVVQVMKHRGPAKFEGGQRGYIMPHPSYLLRLPDPAAKARAYAEFVEDLRRIRDLAA
ncbi:UdgX family uracil-DNA binding protein [Roseomonas haemaphysalidis]|uniref:Type-4 uracil-DNA glycosylase n=1 Tax=Roseomonas haemaphysalidis TaxID=2768162 RepID=A0ABS3KPE3_9PROT|nr:UdgX family uracil-DNA binding protein [Roseomonas haemaphysalidis]MBO1078887.1 UdgX family uracil-DNA binding protein [Roseomonas haemaphysalidis]